MIDDPNANKMPLLEHLIELRRRLMISAIAFFVAFILCYYFASEIYGFLERPLAAILVTHGSNRRMIYTAPTEAFFTYLQVSAFAAAFICFPVWAGQLWAFIAPGLYSRKKRHSPLHDGYAGTVSGRRGDGLLPCPADGAALLSVV